MGAGAVYFAAAMSAVSAIGVALISRDEKKTTKATDGMAHQLDECKAALAALERIVVELRDRL